ncbi:hypothetical protein ABID58_006146 [Bradyrhizobium sp. S3.2.6]|uniref:Uncharacterized protein n=1 Tax=Bradyrhizobium cytisi TaxID=515489 RepID=A0A5S4WFJ3_9BRAD|nr:formate dehydrogenase accessory sulfurtransferase FdhD [Bradyrhizobium cytisi]TYL80870.1 hypothetical protein FXB38_23885 [Bradyrhizobium cytisi]
MAESLYGALANCECGCDRTPAAADGLRLCGIESLREANRVARPVHRQVYLTPKQICISIETLAALQLLNHKTYATHAAGFFQPDRRDMIVREDVGRHNALDKLAGALAVEGVSGRAGAVTLTSRISMEMVQRTAAIGAGVAISAPTGSQYGRLQRHHAGPHRKRTRIRDLQPFRRNSLMMCRTNIWPERAQSLPWRPAAPPRSNGLARRSAHGLSLWRGRSLWL